MPLRKTQATVHLVIHQREAWNPRVIAHEGWIEAMGEAKSLMPKGAESLPLTDMEKADHVLMKLVHGRQFCWVKTVPLHKKGNPDG